MATAAAAYTACDVPISSGLNPINDYVGGRGKIGIYRLRLFYSRINNARITKTGSLLLFSIFGLYSNCCIRRRKNIIILNVRKLRAPRLSNNY